MSSIQTVLSILEGHGYERLEKPLVIVGTEFDFEAAARGTGTSHDLVLIATEAVPARRLTRLVAGLARSLDITASRRPVSIVLIGKVEFSARADLETYARVLRVASTNPGRAEIEKAIAVLLPLKLPQATVLRSDGAADKVYEKLGARNTSPEHASLVSAAKGGTERVTLELKRYIDSATGWNQGDENE